MTQTDQSLRLRAGTLERMAGSAARFVETMDDMNNFANANAFAEGDYKALICFFQYGGNDPHNTLIPYNQASYDQYYAERAGISIQRSALGDTILGGPALPNGRQYALHPNLAMLKPYYDSGKMAAVLNVGTLVAPITKTQFNNASVPIPPKLFSHNDQQSFFQSSAPEGSGSGWGGRIGDAMMDENDQPALTCVNLGSNAVFLTGASALQYTIGNLGPIPLLGNANSLYGSQVAMTRLRNLMRASRVNLLMEEHGKIATRSLSSYDTVSGALNGVGSIGDNVHGQVRIIAKLIAAAQSLGQKRQVFMFGFGGYDTHDSLLTNHGNLMTLGGSIMKSLMDFIEQQGIADKVTIFTASDFGRTLKANGDGSDHGWGGHHFVMGGAVNGGQIYGTPPAIGDNTDSDVGQGRLLPTISVDQYAATIARWFGVPEGDLPTVFPNIGNFPNTNLGFMQ